jgi:hypothetical protein
MARGWESKSVEEQQSDKADRRAFESHPLTSEEAERESLHLQRKRILLAIANSTNPRYIEQQNKALGFIDSKLAELDAGSIPPVK